MLRLYIAVASAALLALSGCAKDDNLRTEGLTLGAGDSIAVNSSLQIIDPWPAGVEDTELLVPSDRGSKSATASSGGGSTTAPTAPTGGAQ
jgi:hypothetical protein